MFQAFKTRLLGSIVGTLLALFLVSCGGNSTTSTTRTFTGANQGYSTDDLYRFFAVAFGAAPGVTYMGQLIEAAEWGLSIKEIVNIFTTKPQFTDTYPLSMSNLDFATKLVNNVVGASANDLAKKEAINDIVSALGLPNWTRGDVIYAVFNNLANKPESDTKWYGTAKKMSNQVVYAKYYTETMKGDSTEVEVLRKVLTAVLDTDKTAVLRTKIITGKIYERLRDVAYNPTDIPSNGIAGATVQVLGLSTKSDLKGDFVITVPEFAATPYTDINVTSQGFGLTRHPLEVGDQNLLIGMYSDVQVQSRPNFIKGVIPHDVGGFFPDIYELNLFEPTFKRIKEKAKGNLVVFVDTIWINELNVNQQKVTLASTPNNGALMSANADMYKKLIPSAIAQGLDTMILIDSFGDELVQPIIWSEIEKVNFDDVNFWSIWFNAYTPLVIERAKIAKSLNVGHLVLGFNQGYLSNAPIQLWENLISEVKKTGYKGKLSYFGMLNAEYDVIDFETIRYYRGAEGMKKFISLFDYVGINIFSAFSKQGTNSSLSLDQSQNSIKTSLEKLLEKTKDYPVPLLAIVGTPSINGGVVNGDYVEPCLGCNSIAPKKLRDYYQQADLYQAFFELINQTPSGNGRFMGVLSWGYNFKDDFGYLLELNDSAYDKSGNVRGKPAESVLYNWFQKY